MNCPSQKCKSVINQRKPKNSIATSLASVDSWVLLPFTANAENSKRFLRGRMNHHQECSSADEVAEAGYISIKDFAYDKSNPLHFGYFGESSEDEEGSVECESESRRQSIVLPSEYIVNRRAVALYDFIPENDNELELREGDVLFIGYRHGQGWLVAENEERTRTGLVPEEYVSLTEPGDDDDDDNESGEERPRPFYLTHMIAQSMNNSRGDENDEDWEDIDDIETNLNEHLRISNSS
ncbi:LAQU0S13e02894g1_1 [Lachancea quebecensis]|uniref:LAQU0S13e02894g1_1 n=1 Tax=Lachancea quebecensis TaxID=1654605 RepID=A0A0P1KVR7_9SACH|nr:LAQU0S13e02894g1_1 [Lachancea quebecensis]